MLDVIKMLKPKQKAPPVKEEPKPEPKKSLLPLSTKGKVFAAIVALHVLFLAYFIWFLVSASITETEDEVASIMRGEVARIMNHKGCPNSKALKTFMCPFSIHSGSFERKPNLISKQF